VIPHKIYLIYQKKNLTENLPDPPREKYLEDNLMNEMEFSESNSDNP